MLILAIIMTVLLIAGIIVHNKTCAEMTGALMVATGGMVLAIIILIWPASYYTTKSEIQEYYSTKQTIEDARTKNIDSIERAALTQKIIDTNNWLATQKFWNKTIFDDVIPDEIEQLEPLK